MRTGVDRPGRGGTPTHVPAGSCRPPSDGTAGVRSGGRLPARPGALDRDPLPVPAGRPPAERLCPERTPPLGLAFVGSRATTGGFLCPCPSCCRGWILLLPTGEPYAYEPAIELGCSRDCAPEPVAWWWLWRAGELPPEPAVPPDRRAERYGAAAFRRELAELLQDPPADRLAGLERAAFVGGQFLDSAGLDPVGLAAELAHVARRLGLKPGAVRAPLLQAATAGRAKPRGVPRP